MTAPPALHPQPPAAADAVTTAGGALGLTALLEMFTCEEPAPAAAPVRRPLRSWATRLHAWTAQWVPRAAAWGSGPGGAWRAW